MNVAEGKAASAWMDRLDGLAEQANTDLKRASAASANPHDLAMPGAALMAIASQLAYGNAVAAATFYMAQKLWVTLDQEAP